MNKIQLIFISISLNYTRYRTFILLYSVMSVIEYEYKKGFPALRLTHPNGSASAEVLLYGAHIYSWKVNEQELLFMRFAT